jgi:outer membrane cobalamin receptor
MKLKTEIAAWIFSVSVALIRIPCFAQQADSLSRGRTIVAKDFVVYGFQPEKLTTKNAVTLTEKEVMAIGSENFIRVVDQLPGIVQISETTFPLLIRGMYGNRIHVEKNGIVKTGIDQTGYMLEDIQPDDVAAVQLLHGARSIVYGSGSIGGVLLVQDKLFFGKSDFGGFTRMSYATNNDERTLSARLSFSGDDNLIRLSGRYTKASNFCYPEKEEALNSSYTYNNLSGTLAHRFRNKSTLELATNYYSGSREKPVGFQNNPFDYRSFFDKYNVESSLRFSVFLNTTSNLRSNFWYNGLNTNQQQDSYNAGTGLLSYRTTRYSFKNSGGFSGAVHHVFNTHWTGQAGMDWFTDRLSQDIGYDDYVHHSTSLYRDYSKQKQDIGGIYLLAEYAKAKSTIGLSLRGDLGRLQKDSLSVRTYGFLSGGVDWEYSFAPWLINELSLSRHFRFPAPMEAIGTFYGGRGTFVGNPDIEPETCYNLEWNIQGKAGALVYAFNAWSSLFFNRISEQMVFTNKYTYVNTSKARVCGMDASLSTSVGHEKKLGKLLVNMSVSYSIGDDVSQDGFFAKGSPLESIPPGRFRSRITYQKAWKELACSVFMVFTHVSAYDRLPDSAVRKSWGQSNRPSYSLWDSGLNLRYHRVNWGILVNNVFDNSYQPYGSYLKGMGQNIKGTVGINF